MAVDDCVVDTNVFLHATNSMERRREDAARFLASLLNGQALLCLDDRMKMQTEYREHGVLNPGSHAHTIFTALLIARRVVLLPPKDIPYRSLATCIHDRTDHIFFRVAAASKSKVLVSHDFDVHPVQGSRQKRDLERLCRAEAVRIVDAAEAFLLF